MNCCRILFSLTLTGILYGVLYVFTTTNGGSIQSPDRRHTGSQVLLSRQSLSRIRRHLLGVNPEDARPLPTVNNDELIKLDGSSLESESSVNNNKRHVQELVLNIHKGLEKLATSHGKIVGEGEEGEEGNCTPPAINQFPSTILGAQIRNRGGILVHVIIALFCFAGLWIACEHYFVPSLEELIRKLKVKPDIAGATFMAGGGGAPSLATAIVGVFVAEDDIGLGAIVGSAIFNLCFVIGMAGMVASKALPLQKWPLFRDAMFYFFSLILLIAAINDKRITWVESLSLVLLYCFYCVFMSLNGTIKRQADRFYQWMIRNERANLTANQERSFEQKESDLSIVSVAQFRECGQSTLSNILANHLHNGQVAIDVTITLPGDDLQKKKAFSMASSSISDDMRTPDSDAMAKFKYVAHALSSIALAPLRFLSMITIPDCKKEGRQKWWPLTFLMAIMWIAGYSYMLVWMMTIIGFTLGIPDTVMGLTLLAGTIALPDLVSTLIVVKNGQGNMGVSNAIASNIFETLMGQGLPWLVKTAIASPGSVVPVESGGLQYTSIGLLVTIVAFLAIIHFSGWELNKKMGTGLIIWYVGGTALAVCVEMNVFGKVNLPTCTSIS